MKWASGSPRTEVRRGRRVAQGLMSSPQIHMWIRGGVHLPSMRAGRTRVGRERSSQAPRGEEEQRAEASSSSPFFHSFHPPFASVICMQEVAKKRPLTDINSANTRLSITPALL